MVNAEHHRKRSIKDKFVATEDIKFGYCTERVPWSKLVKDQQWTVRLIMKHSEII